MSNRTDSSKKKFIPVYQDYLLEFGATNAIWLGVMLNFEDYLEGSNRKQSDWFYHSQKKMMEKTGFSFGIQKRIVDDFIELGIIEKQKRGNPGKNWYKIYHNVLEGYTYKNNRSEFLENPETNSFSKTRKLIVSRKPGNYIDNNIDNNIEKDTHSFLSGNWKNLNFPDKFKTLHKAYPDIKSSNLRFVIMTQETLIKNSPPKFKQYSDSQLINQVAQSCDIIDKLERLDKYEFLTQIKPCIQWAIKDSFWHKQIRSLASLRNKSNGNGETKFTNMYDQWCSSIDLDPKLGRLKKRSDYKIKNQFGEVLN